MGKDRGAEVADGLARVASETPRDPFSSDVIAIQPGEETARLNAEEVEYEISVLHAPSAWTDIP